HAALARGEALVDEWPRANRLCRVESGRRDVQVVPERGELLGKAGERLGHLHLDGELVERPCVLEVDRPEAELPGEVVVVDPLEREDDVVSGEVLAVMEGDAGTEPDDPGRQRPVGGNRLGKYVLDLRLRVELGQRLVQRLQPGSVQVGQALVRVEGFGAGTAGEAQPEGAAAPEGTACPGSVAGGAGD